MTSLLMALGLAAEVPIELIKITDPHPWPLANMGLHIAKGSASSSVTTTLKSPGFAAIRHEEWDIVVAGAERLKSLMALQAFPITVKSFS